MSIIESLKRGLSGPGPGRFTIGDTIASCSHCGSQEFEEGSALLNTVGMTFLDLDWANAEASLLLCSNCSHVEWFLQRPARIESVT